MSPYFDRQAIKNFIKLNSKDVYIPPSGSNGECHSCIVHNGITSFGLYGQLKAKYDTEMKYGFWSTCALTAYPLFRELGGTKENFYENYIRPNGGLECGYITKAILEMLKNQESKRVIRI